MVTEGIEPSTFALLEQRSHQLSYATSLNHQNLIIKSINKNVAKFKN